VVALFPADVVDGLRSALIAGDHKGRPYKRLLRRAHHALAESRLGSGEAGDRHPEWRA
jgi:hypothetical protein